VVESVSRVIGRGIDVEDRIAEILIRFAGKRFNDVTVAEVVRQYDRELEGGGPILLC